MPNVLNLPMKGTAAMYISSDAAHAEFSRGFSTYIKIDSKLNRGIQINSKHKSEQTSIGINDNYLASVTYTKKVFPVYMILSIVFLGIFIFTFSIDWVNSFLSFLGVILSPILSIIFIILYFTEQTARISFRLADEQDYDILLSSSAVQDSELMQKFIEKILMNAMNVEEEITPISLEQTVVIQQPQQPQPAVMQQPQPAVMQQPQQAMQQPQPAVMQQPQQAMQQPYQQPPQP